MKVWVFTTRSYDGDTSIKVGETLESILKYIHETALYCLEDYEEWGYEAPKQWKDVDHWLEQASFFLPDSYGKTKEPHHNAGEWDNLVGIIERNYAQIELTQTEMT